MAGKRFILEILDEMEQYYHYTYNPVQVKALCRQFSAVPSYLLRLAADRWLDTEPRWLPRAANLWEQIRQLQDSGQVLDSTGEPFIPLWAQHEGLKSAYYHEGELDWTRWQALIDLARQLDCPHTAQSIQSTLQTLTNDQKQYASLQ